MAQEEIIFKVGVDTGTAKSDVDKVGDSVENVGKETKKTAGSFTSLRKELKDLTIQLQNLDPASKEFEKVAQRAGQIKEQMRGVADAINDADPEVFGGKFQRTAEGIAGAFSAVTGAQALFGQQSEEIEKQMLKVQGAIALTQGISAMKELRNDATDLAKDLKTKLVTAFQSLNATQISNAKDLGTMTTLQKAYNVVVGSSTGVLKNLRIALAATGIGALILAVGYLIANFDKLKGSMSQSLTNAKNFEQSTTRQAEAARYASDNFAEYERTLKRLGYTEDEISNKRKARFKDAIDKTEKEIGASRKVYDEQLKNLKIVEVFDKIGFNATGRLLFGDEETAKAQQQKVKDLNATLTKLKNDQFDYNAQIKADRQKDIEDQKSKSKQANDEAKATRDAEFKRQLDEIHQNNLKKIELENQRIIEQETLENEYYDSFKTQQQLEEQAVRDKYFKIIQTTKDNEILLLAQQKELDAIAEKYQEEQDKTEQERLDNIAQQYEDFVTQYTEAVNSAQQNEINAVNEKYFNLIEQAKQYGLDTTELERKRAEEIKAIDTELLDAKRNFVNETSNLLGALAGAAEQGSAIQKAFAIAQLAVDTAKSISSVIAGATAAAAATGPAAPFVLAGYIASGIATVTTALSTANKILNAPSPSVKAPQMNRPTDNTQNGGAQGTQTQVNAQSTYKVVVVDSDITKMQDKTKKTELISTI